MSAIAVEEIRTAGALAALEREWNALATAHGDGLPFRTWEWSAAWWRCFAERGVAVKDSLYMAAFRGPGGELVAIAPLMLVRRPGMGPALLRSVEFLGADPYVTELPGVLADRACESGVYAALVAHLRLRQDEWDRVRWRGVPDGGPGHHVLAATGDAHLLDETPSYRLEVAGTWDAFRASRPRNLKESLRRCHNSLRRDGYTGELNVVRAPADVPAAVERFLRLHRSRSEAEDLPFHGNVFGDPAAQAFLREVCGRLAARDSVRVFELHVGGEVVAVRLGFVIGDTLYLYFSGFDPAWARYSVMTTTVAEAIRHAFEHGDLRFVNLSTGTDEAKLRWRPQRALYRGGLQYARGERRLRARWMTDLFSPATTNPVRRLARRVLGRRRR